MHSEAPAGRAVQAMALHKADVIDTLTCPAAMASVILNDLNWIRKGKSQVTPGYELHLPDTPLTPGAAPLRPVGRRV